MQCLFQRLQVFQELPVIRKLNKLIKENFLKIDIKKHYSSTGVYQEEILDVQKNTLKNLSKLTARVYNLNLMKDN